MQELHQRFSKWESFWNVTYRMGIKACLQKKNWGCLTAEICPFLLSFSHCNEGVVVQVCKGKLKKVK
jgi:hypothetical protein